MVVLSELTADGVCIALQRLTEIATEQSGAQVASLVVSGEAGEYNMATSILTPEPCRTYE